VLARASHGNGLGVGHGFVKTGLSDDGPGEYTTVSPQGN
jgi:hypothetical protein